MNIVKPLALALAGLLLFLIVIALEFRDAQGYLYRLFDNEAFLKFDLERSALIWLSGLLLACAAIITQNTKEEPTTPYLAEFKWGLITASLGLSFSLILAYDPVLFSHLVQEDGLIENLSALLFFVSWLLCFTAAYKDFRRGTDRWRSLLLFGIGSLFWLIAMEEVSWFQRALDIETPAIMASNLQGEMNLHNFSTDTAESIYYFGAFVFLILLPAYRGMARQISLISETISVFPTSRVLCAAVIFSAYNGYMWELIFSQLPFFFAFSYMLLKMVTAQRIEEKITYAYFLICLGSTLFLFLSHADDQIRTWDTSEYKELFIPIAFFVYALGQASLSCRAPSSKRAQAS